LDAIGTRYSYNFAKKLFRINGLLEKGANGTTDIDYSPLALGGLTNGATVRDMASAYATFANQGVYREGRTFTKVYDSKGNVIIDNPQHSEQILSEKTVD
jgi:penicillin-binding protein 1A